MTGPAKTLMAPDPRERGAAPLRRCLASGEVRPRRDLLRFVAGPDGRVVPDVEGRLPGRGFWLSPRRDMIEKACARNLFARAARAPVTVPEDLFRQVEFRLRRRCLELLGLARRSGQAVCGREKVAAWLAEGRAALLFQARDAAQQGRRRLRALARAGERRNVAVVEVFTGAELSQALGKGAWVHVAVAPGRLGDRLAEEMARLVALCGHPDAQELRSRCPESVV